MFFSLFPFSSYCQKLNVKLNLALPKAYSSTPKPFFLLAGIFDMENIDFPVKKKLLQKLWFKIRKSNLEYE